MSYRFRFIFNGNESSLGRSLRCDTWRFPSVATAFALAASVAGCLDRPIGASEPVTTNVVVQRQRNDAIKSIDILLMIDNSSSMADKQETLAVAVPELLNRLVRPQCVDDDGKPFNPPVVAALGAENPCSLGAPEFNPVNDIHVGIITSSLGDHGEGSRCTEGKDSGYDDDKGNLIPQPADANDRSYLIGTLTRGKAILASDTEAQATASAKVADAGFLTWGGDKANPQVADLHAASAIFRDLVTATDEKGCGFEAQLEAWFRFLIDPVPTMLPLAPPDTGNHSKTSRRGVDENLLMQRAQFLRPDSMVAIVMLTDENDCSVRDTDYGWVALADGYLKTGSAPCATNPNDPCCYNCKTEGPPSGCDWTCPNPPNQDPPRGANDEYAQGNLRCWHQKERFGMELTYPTSRYSVALTKKELCPDQSFGDMDCDCTYAKSVNAYCDPGQRRYPNPLYSTVVGKKGDLVTDVVGYPNATPRSDNSAVFLAGIVGVPWQDISEPASQGAGETLQYIPVTDERWIKSGGIWDLIVADYNDGKRVPRDPRMVESIMPRDGLPAPAAATNADPIVGHEWNTSKRDLEYACIYRLPSPKSCECDEGDLWGPCAYASPNDCCSLDYPVNSAGEPNSADKFMKPLCQDPSTGNYERTQFFAKAYPGLRELTVLRDYAKEGTVPGNSIVASICPKDLTSDAKSPGYGYNPAVAALIERLKTRLTGSCLPRPLTVAESGEVPCNVIEAVAPSVLGGQDCETFCRERGRNRDATSDNPTGAPSSKIGAAIRDSMKQSSLCDGSAPVACNDMCLCALPQQKQDKNTLSRSEYANDLDVCQNASDHTANALDPGYCYVDPGLVDSAGHHIAGNNPSLVSKCPSTQERILRFVGNRPTAEGGTAVPLTGAMVFSACQGSSIKALD